MPPEPSISNLKQINVVKKQDNLLSKLLILRSRVKRTFAFFDGQNLFYAAEVADEVRKIAQSQDRWLKIASAFPSSPTSRNTRGINKTDWIKIDRALYDSCLDPLDYRPKNP
ncbi:MAG: hypothetical protein L6428_05305 [Candidatus Aminicenantes bacterium]|nr:hypothetical protein [Acidobacteriota bacterium]MCG2810858.1 hypothetical protein [Candidatus Aminicenantes bacterium]